MNEKVGDETTRFVNPHKLVLSCTTLVPATDVSFNGDEPRDCKNQPLRIPQPEVNGEQKKLGVRPMRKREFYSCIDITLSPNGNPCDAAEEYLRKYINVSLKTRNVPLALWGTDALNTEAPPQDQMIRNALMGLEIRTKPGPRPWQTPVLDLKVLAYDRYQKIFPWSDVEPSGALEASRDATISNTIETPEVVDIRNRILATFIDTGRKIMKPEDIRLDQLAKNAEFIFQATPMMAKVGQYPPRSYLET